MKVKYIGENDPLELLNGKLYDVIEIDEISGWYRIVDETEEEQEENRKCLKAN